MNLEAPLETLPGVGPKTAAKLEKAGLRTVRDLLYYFPRTYENYQTATKIADLRPGRVILKARVDEVYLRPSRRRNLQIVEGTVSDDTGSVRVVWFNQPYRARQFQPGQEYYFRGLYDFKYNRYQLTSPSAYAAKDVESKKQSFQSLYSAKSPLKPEFFKKLIESLKPYFADIPDLLPLDHGPSFLEKKSRARALYSMHFPVNKEQSEKGRQYLAYEELFEFLLAARLNHDENQKLQAIQLPFGAAKTKKLVNNLPFKLTDAQRLATWEILQDLEKPVPMNRLLQGDVGSGKTVVAALAAYQAATCGHQTAILAPTAILASQHAESLAALLNPLGVSVGLLTGATKHKPLIKRQIREGNVDVVVGTHALITDDTVFKSLALCVIDEQHRFGVAQRQKLLGKAALTTPGFAPHLLSMTATPIPRSLQLTVFGDLDVSVLNSLPAGRQPIETKILRQLDLKQQLYPIIRQKIKEGEQVYWICPLIEESKTDSTSVAKEARRLRTIFPEVKLGKLHGKMKPAEKDAVMQDFLDKKIDLLVSTTVVEVGVNVPNATQIVIMDAEGYGLAQLHQLRGRVGRGTKASNCYLVTTSEGRPSRRLRELENSTDGFHLAEVDLKLRGPGEIYGSLQHGELNLQIAKLTDTDLIRAARKQVDYFAPVFAEAPAFAEATSAESAADPALAEPGKNMLQYKELEHEIKKYQQLTTLN